MARAGSEIAAVVFEGFMPGDDAGSAVNSLNSVGVNAVTCPKGEFSKAARELEHGVGSGGYTSTAPVPEFDTLDGSEELAA
jgi:hypothetical protein